MSGQHGANTCRHSKTAEVQHHTAQHDVNGHSQQALLLVTDPARPSCFPAAPPFSQTH